MTLDAYIDRIPLLALDALPADERSETESHVYLCDECLAELESYLALAAALVPDQAAPAGVWDRIVSATEQTEIDTVFAKPRTPRTPVLTWLTAAAVGAVLALGATSLVDRDGSSSEQILAAAESAANEQESTVAALNSQDGADELLRVILDQEGHGFVIPGDTLQDLDTGRTYQLWVITPEQEAISAGVLGASPVPATFTWVGDVAGFALTREVEGGVVSSAGDVVSVVTGL